MPPSGYSPPLEQKRSVEAAARHLFKTARLYQRDAERPDYPLDRVIPLALEALFRMERALNPDALAWDNPKRTDLVFRG
jgi:hypothetical protein